MASKILIFDIESIEKKSISEESFYFSDLVEYLKQYVDRILQT